MARTPETDREWLEYWDKKRKTAADLYQSSGARRYDNEAYKYERVVEAFRAKIRLTEIERRQREEEERYY